MHIVFICNEYPPFPHGGVGVVVRLLGQELSRLGYKVTVIGPYLNSKTSTEFDGSVRVVRTRIKNLHNLGWIMQRVQLALSLREMHSRDPIDVVIVPDWLGLVPWNPLPKPMIAALHGTCHFFNVQENKKPDTLVSFFEKYTLKSSNAWTAPSKYIFDQTASMFGIKPHSHIVVPNPISPPTDLYTEQQDQNLILFVGGSLAVKKGVLTVAAASREFLRYSDSLRLVFLGRSVPYNGYPIEREIYRIARDEHRNQIVVLPPVAHEQVWKWMRRSRICVMPSYSETFGNVWAEAMACGRPVIGSTAGPGPEVIQDEVTGVLANPSSSEDVAQKVLRILADKNWEQWLSHNAREWALTQFSVTNVADALLCYYEKILMQNV